MSAPPRKPATYQDLVELAPELLGQIVDGELFASPRPTIGHTRVASVLGGELFGPFDRGRGGGPGGWLFLDEPELHLGSDVLVPDLAGWRRTRLPQLPPSATPYLTLAPDWICEVLSPGTVALDRARKMPIYGRENVQHVWLIDPLEQTLEVYAWRDGVWLVAGNFAGQSKVRAPPFEELDLDLGTLWLSS